MLTASQNTIDGCDLTHENTCSRQSPRYFNPWDIVLYG